MKRLSSLVLGLLLAVTSPLSGRCAEEAPDGAAAIAAPWTETAAPAEPVNAVTGSAPAEPVAGPFRERPYRIWPLYYHRHFTPEHERTIYGPLWLTEDDGEETLTYPLWPFTGVTRTNEGNLAKLDIIWPFIGYQQQKHEENYNLLWPVTGYSRSATSTRESVSLSLLRPLVGYYRETTRDPESHRVTGERAGFPPFYFGSQSGDETVRYVFPSFLSGAQPARERRWHTLFPLYLYAGTPDSSFLFALPSYLRIRNPERDLHSFLPFFHADEGKNESALYVFPSYFRRKAGDGGSLTGLLPFYLGGSGSAGDSFRYVFPNWYERHREGYDTTWFPPFFAASDDETGDIAVHRRSILGPLYLDEQRDDGSRRTSLLLNLFYRKVDTQEDERFTTILWPLVTYGESPDHREFRLWPYSYEEALADNYRAHYLLWPLIGFGSGDHESTSRALPLFYRRETPDLSLTLVAPLYLQSRTPERRFSLLFPLYGNYASADREWTVLLPAAWGKSGERRFSLLFPFYSSYASADREWTVLPPAAWGKSGERRFSLLFPVWYRSSHGDDAENVVLNTWWSREGDRRTFAFAPLYYRSADTTGARNQLLNTWWERERDRTSFAFVPLFYRSVTPSESRSQLLNTWWSGGERLERFVFFPLAWYHSPTAAERDFTLFPLFSYSEKGDDSSTFSFLWRLYYQQREGENSMAALLWWLYRTEERPNYHRLMCWPFIDFEHNSGATDEVFSSFLLRFVTYERNGERLRVRLLGMTIHEK